ncbi:MAG: hypothetical protein JW768_09400 [Chitinispirillaceae bacterium]|nr:hypothetical protein [Chitinispirillaceae bacterium]
MLEKVDLKKSVTKSAFHDRLSRLEPALGRLQREALDLGIPVCIVFEGLDAAGKGALINRLILAMDPRGVTVHSTKPPSEEEALRPFLWRFWEITPAKGRIALFDRSWYNRVLNERVDRSTKMKETTIACTQIKAFERQLTSGGTLILKFFLHISKKEQKKRFKAYESNPATAWKVTKGDWKRHKQYDRYVEAMEELVSSTSTTNAPWTLVGSNDLRLCHDHGIFHC